MLPESALDGALEAVPHCLVAALLDISTGALLALRSVDDDARSNIEAIALAVCDLLELHVARRAGELCELVVASRDHVRLAVCGTTRPHVALLAVCRADVSIAEAVARARACLSAIEGTL